MLHNDKETFKQLILKVYDATGIKPEIIEKDYYVTLFLKEIVKKQPKIIFKGGTSLSKCYKLINRFSEDIDLNIDTKGKPTEGERRRLKEDIVSIIDNFGFTVTNLEDTRSRRSYNKYVVDYPSVFGAEYLKENLIIETSVYIRAYPHNTMTAASFIYDYLAENNMTDFIKQYELEPFKINVQTAERTLIDKVYALGDYYLSGKVTEHSRHIYDLYKLLEVVKMDDNLKALRQEVAAERKNHPACLSAQDSVNMPELLKEIVEKQVYKNDYETITAALLFEEVPYEEAITAIDKIVEYKIM